MILRVPSNLNHSLITKLCLTMSPPHVFFYMAPNHSHHSHIRRCAIQDPIHPWYPCNELAVLGPGEAHTMLESSQQVPTGPITNCRSALFYCPRKLQGPGIGSPEGCEHPIPGTTQGHGWSSALVGGVPMVEVGAGLDVRSFPVQLFQGYNPTLRPAY